jgi:hypothetical protein
MALGCLHALAGPEQKAVGALQAAETIRRKARADSADLEQRGRLLRLALLQQVGEATDPTTTEPPSLNTGYGGGGFGTRYGVGGFGGGYGGMGYGGAWLTRNQAGAALVVGSAELKPTELSELREDLAVMSRILGRTLEQAGGPRESYSALGINLLLAPGTRQFSSVYLEGYGVMFFLIVKCPLSPPPEKEVGKETTEYDSLWEETRRELFSAPGSVEQFIEHPDDPQEEYNAHRVSELKQKLLESLRNATHIRRLKSEDRIVIAVQGGNVASAKRSTGKPAVSTSRRSRAAAEESKPTVMTICVKKVDAEAFAKGKVSLEDFSKRASIVVY